MTIETLIGLSLLFFIWIILEVRLLWVNYLGRFKYRLYEESNHWRGRDKVIGKWSLLEYFLGTKLAVVITSAIFVFLLRVPVEITLSSVFSAMIGATFIINAHDSKSVKDFEEECLPCEHKQECLKFHEEMCRSKARKQKAKGVVLWERKHTDAESD